MNQRYKNYIMWALYAALFLTVMLLQQAVFGRVRIWGVKLSLIPVVLVCVSVWVGHEKGGIYCLIAAIVWYLSGAEDGSIGILTLTLCGILSGFACRQFSHRFFPTLALCLGAMLLHEGVIFLMKYYLGAADGALIGWVFKTMVLSLPAAPVCYVLCKFIRKVAD